jgi:hypothetical protein
MEIPTSGLDSDLGKTLLGPSLNAGLSRVGPNLSSLDLSSSDASKAPASYTATAPPGPSASFNKKVLLSRAKKDVLTQMAPPEGAVFMEK